MAQHVREALAYRCPNSIHSGNDKNAIRVHLTENASQVDRLPELFSIDFQKGQLKFPRQCPPHCPFSKAILGNQDNMADGFSSSMVEFSEGPKPIYDLPLSDDIVEANRRRRV